GALMAEAIGESDGASELAAIGPDMRALTELARAGGGIVDPEPAETLRSGGPRGRTPIATGPWLLIAAAVLAALEGWLRRLGARRTSIQALRALHARDIVAKAA